MLISDDAGASWSPSDLGRLAQTVRDIVIDPTTAAQVATTHMYAGGQMTFGDTNNAGIYKSVDGGTHWQAIDQGIAHSGTVRQIVLDPRSCSNPPSMLPCEQGPQQSLYLLSSGTHSGSIYINRIAHSTDAGASWRDASGDLPNTARYGYVEGESVSIMSLVIDPGAANVLYVGTHDDTYAGYLEPVPTPHLANGVFRSDDGGAHWVQRNEGLPARNGVTGEDVPALAGHPTQSGVLWAAVSDINAKTSSRIFKTIDGGDSWQDLSAGYEEIFNCNVRKLSVDPTAPDRLYAGGYSTNGSAGCLFRSEDGGVTWAWLGGDLWFTGAPNFALDPNDPKRLLVATNTGVWEWRQLPDAIFSSGFE